MLFKNPVRTSKRTPHFTITKINWLTLFKEIIAIYSENGTKSINTTLSVTDCRSRWYIQLPLSLKGLNDVNHLIFVVVKWCVSTAVRTGFLNIIQWSSGFKRLICSKSNLLLFSKCLTNTKRIPNRFPSAYDKQSLPIQTNLWNQSNALSLLMSSSVRILSLLIHARAVSNQ
jgi:hypothetical protein